MIINIIALVSLATVCACNTLLSDHEPHNSVKHAISSQSFIRHDVPLAYKYSAVHIYSTERPHHNDHKPLTPPKRPNLDIHQQGIQYAPIIREKKTKIANKPSVPESIKINSEAAKKSNLEPKFEDLATKQVSFIPGYNIEVLQSANKNPGHNAVYRSNPNMKPYEKSNQEHFLDEWMLREMKSGNFVPDALKTTTAPPIFDFVPKQYIPVNSQTYEKEPVITDISTLITPQLAAMNLQIEGYQPYPKTHRMLLNIARTHNFANPPYKAPPLQDKHPHVINNPPIKIPTNFQEHQAPRNAPLSPPNLLLSNDQNLQHNQKTRLFLVKYRALPKFS